MKHIRKPKRVGALNITPMIDIIFQLLIFFMLTSSIISRSALDMKLPESSTADKVAMDDTVLWMFDSGKITVNDEPVDREHLLIFLKTIARKKNMSSIVIKGDRNITYQALVDMMDICRAAGLVNISLAVDHGVTGSP